MKNFLKRAAAFLRAHINIILKVCVSLVLAGALFSYTYLIQRELMVADNHGMVTLVASGKDRDGVTNFYQQISRITINGQVLDAKYIKKNDWASQKIDAINTSYFTSVTAEMAIDYPQPIKTISVEYQKNKDNGVLQFYLDDELIQEVDSYAKKFGQTLTTVAAPQRLGVNLQNIFWYLLICVFTLSSLTFIYQERYKSLSLPQLTKFALLAFACVASISMALDHLYGKSLTLFNSSIVSQSILPLALLNLLFIAITLSALRLLIPSKIKQAVKLPYHFIFFLPPVAAVFLMELTYSSIAMQSSAYFYNLLMVTVIYLILSLITASFRIGGGLLLLLATSFGIINKVMIETRGQPLLHYHFLQFRDGLNIAGSTKLVFDNSILQAIFLTWIGVALLFFLPKVHLNWPASLKKKAEGLPRFLKHKVGRHLSFALTGLLIAFTLLPSLLTGLAKTANIKLSYWQMQETYARYGSVLALTSFYVDSLIEQPQGYSQQAVSDILDEYQPDEADSKTKRPNLVIIQNESQADFTNLPNLQLSADPMAFQHSLTKNANHGSLNVSVFGGGTANTEYEVLTSNALTMLSNNVFPYQQLIDGERSSLASLLDNYGYDSVAMHPQSGLNYNRSNVYEALGFSQSYFLDSKPSINQLYDLRMERDFVSDHSLFQGIQKLYEEKGDAPLFSFVVTMQGHGSYDKDSYENPIVVNGSTETYSEESEFLSSVQSSDQAFKELITYFEGYKEPTIVIMYGDHQPSLSDNFYQAFMPDAQDGQSGDISAKHATPFIVWANFDIPEQTSKTISPNFLVPYAIELTKDSSAPLPTSAYYQFLNKLQTEVPVITTWGYKTASGKYQKELKDSQLLKDYRIVEYNSAIDSNTLNQYFDNK